MRYICIKQHDNKDCGAACLAIIGRNYGLDMPLVRYTELVKTDTNGTNIYGIVDGASKLGIEASALAGEWEDLLEGIRSKEIKFPFIAQVFTGEGWEHYIVVYKINKNNIIIADPAIGIKKITIDVFRSIWIGNIMTFSLTERFKKKKEKKNFFFSFFALLKEQKKITFFLILCSIIISSIGILGAVTFQYMIDMITSRNELMAAGGITSMFNKVLWGKFTNATLQDTLTYITISVIFLYVLEVFIRIIRGYLSSYISGKLDIAILLKYFNHVTTLPMSFMQSIKTGEVLSRFSDVAKIREAITNVMFSSTMDALMVVFGGVILYNISAKLFIWILILSGSYGIIMIFFKNPINQVERNIMENNARVTSYLKESIEGIETTKLFCNEENVKSQMNRKLNEMVKSIIKGSIIINNKDALVTFIGSAGMIILFWLGLSEVYEERLSIGTLIAFQSLSIYFLNPFSNLVGLQSTIQIALVASDRLSDMLLLSMEDLDDGVQPKDLKVDILLKHVNFRYGHRELVLNDISLEIKKGEKIGIVGESGSGKTSLSKLLLALYEPESGEIFYGSNNIQQINKSLLRNKVAYLQQDLFFFSDSIKNNIKIGYDDITDKEVEEVCRKSLIHKFIETLPFQYDTILDERGTNLSGGQKQLVALARALVKKPDILILDEVTSNLDSVTEKAVQTVINHLNQTGTTCILIAHRLKTVKDCDRIYVMEQGTIVEEGCHDELILNKKQYYNMWKNT